MTTNDLFEDNIYLKPCIHYSDYQRRRRSTLGRQRPTKSLVFSRCCIHYSNKSLPTTTDFQSLPCHEMCSNRKLRKNRCRLSRWVVYTDRFFFQSLAVGSDFLNFQTFPKPTDLLPATKSSTIFAVYTARFQSMVVAVAGCRWQSLQCIQGLTDILQV